MAVTIFSDSGFRGKQVNVVDDVLRVSSTPAGPSPGSIRLTGNSDAALLFSSPGWKGRMQYLTGPGGRANLGRSVSSIRVSSFRLYLNITVVSSGFDKLPGRWETEHQARREIVEAVSIANAFLASQLAMLELLPAEPNFDRDNRYFDVPETSRDSARRRWKSAAMVDVIFVNSIGRGTGETTSVRAHTAGRGQHIYLVAAPMPVRQYSDDEEPNPSVIARHLVEEIGAFCGMQKSVLGRSGRPRQGIADAGSLASGRLAKASMKKTDILAIHDVLANVFERKYDRLGEGSAT